MFSCEITTIIHCHYSRIKLTCFSRDLSRVELSEQSDELWCLMVVGCLRDVRLNNMWLPMDPSENDASEAAHFSPRSQNIHSRCESNACAGILCEPGLICVDVWRLADCRWVFFYTDLPVHRFSS